MLAQFDERCCRSIVNKVYERKQNSLLFVLIHLFLSEKISEITCQSTQKPTRVRNGPMDASLSLALFRILRTLTCTPITDTD